MLLKPYKPNDRCPWNFGRVWTLHRRTCYAGTWEELQRDLADGPEKSIERIFAGHVRSAGVPDNFKQMREILGKSAVSSERPERLIAWWIYQMYFSPDPLRERLSTMWHNHFATSNAKLKDLDLMRLQNQLFRRLGSGNFKKLLTATLTQAAMLKWLDGDENRVGKPNENLGRELLELFTLGAGHFTEQDVKEASRALTGWGVNGKQFRARDDWHDAKAKTILGQTGEFDGYDLIDITCDHDQTVKRLAWRIASEFLAATLVTEPLIDELAKALEGENLEIEPVLRRLLSSELFFSQENLNRKIIEPESFVVGSVRCLEMFAPTASTMVLGDWVQQLGRKLFYPPNVGGWPGGRAWLNSRTTIARANFGSALVNGRLKRDGLPVDLVGLAGRYDVERVPKSMVQFYLQLLTGDSKPDQVNELLAGAQDGNKDRKDDLNVVLRSAVANIVSSPDAQLC